jgi:arsenite transporter
VLHDFDQTDERSRFGGKAVVQGLFGEIRPMVWVSMMCWAANGTQLLPGVFRVIGDATVAQVNLPVAVLVWLMIVPMLLKIDLAALREVGQHWRGIATTVGINWLIKPFSMALLGWIFIAHLFRRCPWSSCRRAT